MESIKNYFKFCFDFVGVCERKDFWLPFTLVMLVSIVSWTLAMFGFVFQIIAIILFIALVVPTTSLVVRRLHDTDRGAIYLLWLIFPVVGTIILLVYLFEKTKYFPSANN